MTGMTPAQAACEAYGEIWANQGTVRAALWEAAAKAAVATARIPGLVITFDEEITEERAAEIRRALEAALTPDAASERIADLLAEVNALTAERDAACEQSAVARERLRNLTAKQPPELTAARAETRAVRNVLAHVFGSFSVPDQRRMRHASVTAATIERWKTDAGLDPATSAKEG